jgi:hypothetical protein
MAEVILKKLQDPAWWFDLIIIGIVVSVVAGFLKDATSRWLARSSEWYRRRRAATLRQREFHLELLLSDPTLLSAHNSVAVILVILFVMTYGMVFIIPLYMEMIYSGNSPYFASRRSADGYVLFRVLHFAAGIICAVAGHTAMSHFAVARRAYYTLVRRRVRELREEAERQEAQNSDITPPSPTV